MNDLNPHDEERYLVTVLLSATTQAVAGDALETISPDDFWDPHIREVWKASRVLRDQGQRLTSRALSSACSSAAVDALLRSIAGQVPRAGDYPQAAAEVLRNSRLRRLMEALDRIRQRALAAEDHASALDAALEELSKLDRSEEPTEAVRIGQLVDDLIATVTTRTPQRVIPTPWPAVNEEIAGGLHGGRFYVVGARPGEGKSIAAHNIAVHAAALGFEALVFSMEMSREEVAGRVLANGAAIELREVITRNLSDWSLQQAYEFADRARAYPLSVIDRSEITMPYIRSACRNHKRRHGLDVIAIDYLQLIGAESSRSREQEVARMSRQLKLLGRELDAAVVVPAQLNRALTTRPNPRPLKSDLRESGGIEADADVVMLLARGVFPADHPMAGEFNGELNVYIDKNRHGRECHFSLPWRAHYATIG